MPAHFIAEEGPQKGLVLSFEKGDTWTIGRDPDVSNFVIEDSTVSRKHLRVKKTEDGILIENLSRVNPTLLNDEVLSGKTLLKEGDRIQIGNSVFLFSNQAIEEGEKQVPLNSKYDAIFHEAESGGFMSDSLAPPPEPPPPSKKNKKDFSSYDTIFEDAGEDPPLPLNFLSETPLMLKVISGPNAGGEIGIEKGRTYIIGKDPNSSDIVFQDLSVSRNHAKLTVSDEGTIEIEDLGSKNGTAVNGNPISEKKEVTTQDLIALGTTVFLIIDRQAPQETIYSPMVPPSYDSLKEPPSVEEEPTISPTLEEKEKKTDWKRDPIPTKYLVIAACFCVSFLIIFLSFFSLFKSKNLEIAQKEPSNAIQEALAKYEDVKFSYNPASGKLFLVGHVLTGIEEQELKYRLSELSFITSYESTIVIDELVWKTMNDVLYENTPWKGVFVHSIKPGSFIINGFVQTGEEYTALSEYLCVNFPYMDRLENSVIITDTLTTQLQSLLVSSGFSAVTFQTANGEVILSGRYSETMATEYERILKQIQSIKGVTAVKNFATPSHPNQAAIDLTQQFQVTGTVDFEGKGFNILLNGRIYNKGDEIQGMKITTIEKNTVLLEKDGMKYKIDYTR